MAKGKAAGERVSVKSGEDKTRKTAKTTNMKMRSTAERAAAVEANLGGSEPLREFLSKVGWD